MHACTTILVSKSTYLCTVVRSVYLHTNHVPILSENYHACCAYFVLVTPAIIDPSAVIKLKVVYTAVAC